MQQNPSGGNLQVYASLSTIKVEPPQNEMTKGVVPLDTLPAGWWNWLWNAITQAQNNAQYSLDTVYQEINAVLTHAGITPDPTQFDQLKQAIIKLRTQIATAIDVGSVLSTETGTDGSVKVAADGKMTVNGFGDLQQLQTLMKDTLVEAINEVFNVASALDSEVGDLTTLATENKTTIVSAINELKEASGEGAAALEGKIGNMDNLQTSAKDTLVSAINEVNDKEITLSGQISPRFTYVVDSDQALHDWYHNVEGNDYSYVLIRRGTWTISAQPDEYGSSPTLNFNVTRTYGVEGEPGSKIVLRGAAYLSGYQNEWWADNFPGILAGYKWARNVTIERGELGGVCMGYWENVHNCVIIDKYNASGMDNCTNIRGCTLILSTELSGGTFPRPIGAMRSCSNIYDCDIDITYAEATMGENSSWQSFPGLNSCTNIHNCSLNFTCGVSGNYLAQVCDDVTNITGSTVTVKASSTIGLIGLGGERISNCSMTIDGGKGPTGIMGKQISNCVVDIKNGSGDCVGFLLAYQLSNCRATVASLTGSGVAFNTCEMLTACSGVGTTSSTASNKYGLGFNGCKGMTLCGTHGNSTDYTLNGSYATFRESSTNVATDTADGGFNDAAYNTIE